MSEKPKTADQVRKERWFRQVSEIKALGDLALREIDEALAGNAEIIDFPVPEEPPETCA